MDVEDAIIAADFVDCDKILGTITTLLVTSKLIINKAISSFLIKGKDLMLLEMRKHRTIIFLRLFPIITIFNTPLKIGRY
jgi:hypothetical protein